MTKKGMFSFGAAGVLALAGCQSGMYSCEVSAKRNNNGISDFTVVNSLDVAEFPQSMPVVVESKSTHEIGEHGWNNLLWFLTLGIVPGISSEETVYDVTVKTPLGEKSGACKVEACSWIGWLPIFIPYPGIAEERTANPQLPNAAIEGKVRDQLVANLVSQFSKKEYAEFAAKNNSPELKAQRARMATERKRLEKEQAAEAERVRVAKEKTEREEKMRRTMQVALAVRTAIYEKTVEQELAKIKECYSKGEMYESPFIAAKVDALTAAIRRQFMKSKASEDWLAKWVSPRFNMTEADALVGEALLAEFGAKYLPNAYANYEKKREAAIELQQVFNEEFQRPWTIKATSPKWNSFNKVLEKFVKARTEYFICHDEICHYWLLSRFGVLTDKDFAMVDTQRLAVHLLPENVGQDGYALLRMNPMEGKVSDFAVKYAPESNAIYQKMGREFRDLDALLSEVVKQHNQMDIARYSRVLAAAVAKRNNLVREMNSLTTQFQAWYMDHKTTEKSSEEVAKCDAAMAIQLKPFMDALPTYIKEHAIGPIIANSDMIAIPGQRYRMQRTEVTQLQWMAVMGNNPSSNRGPDLPVEEVSWADCQEFIKRASQMDGRKYRLPKEKEWEFACRAGSTTDWGRRANGECGPLETMGWYSGNNRGNRGTHAVALKEPNAWGLFDMHGNVSEWCEDRSLYNREYRVVRGGSYCDSHCTASTREDCGYRNSDIGFRLAASQD